jgi:hypothetical protein
LDADSDNDNNNEKYVLAGTDAHAAPSSRSPDSLKGRNMSMRQQYLAQRSHSLAGSSLHLEPWERRFTSVREVD